MVDSRGKSSGFPAWGATATSILNGCIGDCLTDRDNGLAIDMVFYGRGKRSTLAADSLRAESGVPTGKLCALLDGLCCHGDAWNYPDDPARSHGSALRDDLGYALLFLRCNTCLPIPYNGKSLDMLLEELLHACPERVDEIILDGDGMGGLVIQGACHYGVERDSQWVSLVSRAFNHGTPHEGTMLAKVARRMTSVSRAVPHPGAALVGDVAGRRSQGVKNPRDGTTLQAADCSDLALASAQHYLIAGTVTEDPDHLAARLFGDGLVHAPQAGDNVRLFPGRGHIDLANDEAALGQIRTWCAST
jgi:hypothetical protein